MIEIKDLTKSFNNKLVLNQIKLEIGKGEIHCLLGKNGAGKTTLINILSGFLNYDSGNFTFSGKDLTNEVKKNIGLVSDENFIVEEFTCNEYLTFIAHLYKIDSKEAEKRIKSLDNFFFNDENVLSKQISTLSSGMKKKIELCGAVLHKPDYLILDEPFTGLDPIASNKLVEFILNYQNGNRVIFISSHNLNQIEQIATKISILNKCKIIFEGTIKEFTKDNLKKFDKTLLETLGVVSSNMEELMWIL